jgi:hypothetical protein
LAFISGKSLTGYDNEQAVSGECQRTVFVNGTYQNEGGRCREVFLYDTETNTLVCASCDPSGARPTGPSSLSQREEENVQPPVLYRPRNLTESGILFFESSDGLVAHAQSGEKNVYEYQDGHVYAISDVEGSSESFFLDASPSGEDAFFATAEQLLPHQGTGDNVAVYDARVNGGFPVAAPECTTAEACRNASPPTPAVFGPPPSATFSGPGNIAPPPPAVVKPKPKTAAQLKAEKLAKALKVCRKDKSKSKRTKCEKQAKAKYGPTKKKAKAKKANTKRGAKR